MGNSHIKLSDWIFDEPVSGLILPTAAVAYWKLDEASGDAADSIASYTLAQVGTVPADSDGLFGNCRGGFTDGNYLTSTGLSSGGLAADANFDVSTGSTWYIDCYIKPYSASSTSVQMPVCAMNRDTGIRYDYDATNVWTVQGLQTSSSNANNSSLSPSVPNYLGEWIHIMFAKTGEGAADQTALWINGVEVGADDSVGYAYVHGEFMVGKRNSSTSYYATTVKICDLVWGHGLTTDTVPGSGTIKERLAEIALVRYNGGLGQQYVI